MFYFDTSFLVPLLIPENTSEQVDAFFHDLVPEKRLVVSQWGHVEFGSVLSRLVRMKQLNRSVAAECGARFEMLLAESFEVVTPGVTDFDRGWSILTRFDNGLRAGDALHLAIAGNLGAEAVYTLDNGMLEVGRLLGIPVDRGIIKE